MAYNDDHTYIPTEWFDDMEPPIDAEHLNKIEQALKKNGDSLNEMAEAIGEGGQLKANGFVYVDKIETGIEPAPDPTLDADKLGGKLPEEYALRAELDTATPVTQGDYFLFEKGNYIAAAGLTNAPNSTDGFFVRVTVEGTQKIIQAKSYSDSTEFSNYYNGSSWSGWQCPFYNYIPTITAVQNTVEDITNTFNNYSNNFPNGTKYCFRIPFGVAYPPFGNAGGIWVINGQKNIDGYEYQTAQSYQGSTYGYRRSKDAGVWSDWDSVVMGSQLARVRTENLYTLDNSNDFTLQKLQKIGQYLANAPQSYGEILVINGNNYVGTYGYSNSNYWSVLIHSYNGKIYHFYCVQGNYYAQTINTTALSLS